MKLLVVLTFGLLLASLGFLVLQNQQTAQQLQSALSYQTQLQQLSEDNARQRLRFEAQIEALNQQLLSSSVQLTNLSNTLQETRLQIDPDYEKLLQQARTEVAQQQTMRQGDSNRGSAFASYSDPSNAKALAMNNMPRLYDSYLNALGIPGTERQLVMDAIVDFAALHYQRWRP